MISKVISNSSFPIAASVGLLGTMLMSLNAQAEVTWNIVGTSPGEPDLVGTVTTPDIPVNCGGEPATCPIYGTLTIPAGTSVGGGPYSFDLIEDTGWMLIEISASPLSSGDKFFLFDLNRYALLCDSASARVFECTEPFTGAKVAYTLELTEQQPSVAIGDGNIVFTGQSVGPAEPPTLYSVGDTGPAGGIVFYVTNSGLHGLEAAQHDQGIAKWGCDGVAIAGADETAIGTGAQNTMDILAGCPEFDAARIARNYSPNGFTDWFLPSKGELNLINQNLYQAGLGGFGSSCYWSSSEYDDGSAWCQVFGVYQSASGKSNANEVRPVRAF